MSRSHRRREARLPDCQSTVLWYSPQSPRGRYGAGQYSQQRFGAQPGPTPCLVTAGSWLLAGCCRSDSASLLLYCMYRILPPF